MKQRKVLLQKEEAITYCGTIYYRFSAKVPTTRVELARPKGHKALNLARLPIPSRGQNGLNELD